MTVTMQQWLGIALLLSLAASGSRSDDPKPMQLPKTEEAAIKAVRALGGQIVRDAAAEGKPIVKVDLNGKPVTDKELKSLKELKGLQTLHLIQTQVTDMGLKELKGLTK